MTSPDPPGYQLEQRTALRGFLASLGAAADLLSSRGTRAQWRPHLSDGQMLDLVYAPSEPPEVVERPWLSSASTGCPCAMELLTEMGPPDRAWALALVVCRVEERDPPGALHGRVPGSDSSHTTGSCPMKRVGVDTWMGDYGP